MRAAVKQHDNASGDPRQGENPDAVYDWSIGGTQVSYAYDALGRVTSRTVNGNTTQYTYKSGASSGYTTGMVERVQNGVYGDYEYTYDGNGNITAITDRSSGTAKHIYYVYDANNQLVRENNEIENKSYTWTYDGNGNIQNKKTYAYTTGTLGTATNTVTYGYNSTNADLLISYNGQSITYDAIGNPLNYRGMSMSWTQGRRLASLTKNGVTSTYTYNADGIRTSKTVGSNTTSYLMIDGTVTGFTQSNYRVEFLFDNAGRRIGFTLTIAGMEIPYYYEFNAQGDVVGLYDKYGDLYATYRYDAWGKLLAIYDDEGSPLTDGIAVINPIRYRDLFLFYIHTRPLNPIQESGVNHAIQYLNVCAKPKNNILQKKCACKCITGT